MSVLKNIHISKPSFVLLIISYLIIIVGTGIISESEVQSYIFSILVVIIQILILIIRIIVIIVVGGLLIIGIIVFHMVLDMVVKLV